MNLRRCNATSRAHHPPIEGKYRASGPFSLLRRILRKIANNRLLGLNRTVDRMPHIPKILSLDGGGVRGLSSLLILREIMEDVEQRLEADEIPKPCEYFDLIGGTSTGGLIAIMLGLLGMVVPTHS